jgi:small conductance mechanosensitive channel
MTAKDITLDFIIRYGFQILGASIIVIVGVLLARWIGNLTNRGLEARVKEPPMRLLIVRTTRILVLMLTLLAALDKLGFQIAPLVAAVGVAGVGVGFAFHGVLANIIAGLSIVFTKPYRVGEYIELLSLRRRTSSRNHSSHCQRCGRNATGSQLDNLRNLRTHKPIFRNLDSEPCVAAY